MVIGKVIGNLWATRKDEKLNGLKLLVVQHTDLEFKPKSSFVIAVDAVGAGLGDQVMVTTGSSARQSELTAGKPVDAVISGIIDRIDVGQ